MIAPYHISELCKQYDIVPTKGKGQHFLLDESVVDRIVVQADIVSSDTVVEIGPGFGILTQRLIDTNAQVIAIELEKKVIPYLQDRFAKSKNFCLIEGDVLKLMSTLRSRVLGRYKVVANLPYAITSPILKIFLTAENRPHIMVVMMQKEVAERICAKPGAMSVLALSVQWYGAPVLLEVVPKTKFWPEPRVDSAILAIKTAVLTDADIQLEIPVFRLAKIAFAGKRKQLHNTLASGLHITSDEAKKLLERAGIDIGARPQMLSIEDWKRMARVYIG